MSTSDVFLALQAYDQFVPTAQQAPQPVDLPGLVQHVVFDAATGTDVVPDISGNANCMVVNRDSASNNGASLSPSTFEDGALVVGNDNVALTPFSLHKLNRASNGENTFSFWMRCGAAPKAKCQSPLAPHQLPRSGLWMDCLASTRTTATSLELDLVP
jgi:hypothetical protein